MAVNIKDAAGTTVAVREPVALGPAAKAAAIPFTMATDDPTFQFYGAVTETAPTTDTGSAGINGRLQRVAQRLTSMIALLPASVGPKAKAGALAVTLATDDPSLDQGTTALGYGVATGIWQGAVKTVFDNILTKLSDVRLGTGTALIGAVNLFSGGAAISDANPLATRAIPATKLPTITKTEPAIAAGAAVTVAANANRVALCVQNKNSTGFLRVNETGTADATTGLLLLPGQGYDWPQREVPVGAISIYSSVAGSAYVREGA